MRATFPAYDYDDMVAAQYRLVTEGLHLDHLRLVMGYSMGGMQTLAVGRAASRFRRRLRADGGAAVGDGEPELDDAAADGGDDPQRSEL